RVECQPGDAVTALQPELTEAAAQAVDAVGQLPVGEPRVAVDQADLVAGHHPCPADRRVERPVPERDRDLVPHGPTSCWIGRCVVVTPGPGSRTAPPLAGEARDLGPFDRGRVSGRMFSGQDGTEEVIPCLTKSCS